MSIQIEPYGLDLSKFEKTPKQIEIELLYIANSNPEKFGGLPRGEHIRKAIKILWPWWDQYWHEWSDLCLWAWLNYQEIGMTGCAAAHKTFTFSGLSELEWLASPFNTTLLLTSTTIGSLRARIWSEIKKFYETASIQFGYNLVDSMEKIQFKKGDDKHAIRGMAVVSGEVQKAVGNIQGQHPERMILTIDEAAQTPPAVMSARANLSTGTTFYRCVAIANASDPYDAHGLFCQPKNGWSTISVEDESWETTSGICVHFDGLKSPNVKRNTKYFPRLFDQDQVVSIREKFGENSLEWWMYVRGFWAPTGVRNTVLDAAIISAGKASQMPIWEGSGFEMYAALDPAFTTDGDRCVLRIGRVGNFLDGKQGLYLYKPHVIKLIQSKDNPINYQIAYEVKRVCEEYGVLPQNFSMDETSATGLADIISQIWSSEIRRVSFGGAATMTPVSFENSRPAKEIYDNRVTQLWFSVFYFVQAGRMRGLDDETAKEFCTRQYSLKGEKRIVETKKEMKKRTGGESPDLADPVALLVDHILFKTQGLLNTNSKRGQSWEAIVKKRQIKSSYAAIN